MSMKTQQDNNVVEQLKSIVAEKEAKVHRLEDEIQQLKLNVSVHFSPILNFLMNYFIAVMCKQWKRMQILNYLKYLEWRLWEKINVS